jgi:hypothetical protein
MSAVAPYSEAWGWCLADEIAATVPLMNYPGFFCNGPLGVNPCLVDPVVGFGLLSAVGAGAAACWCPIEIARPI